MKKFIYNNSSWVELGDQNIKEISPSNVISGTTEYINSGLITSNNAKLWTDIQPNTITLTDDIMKQIIERLSVKPTFKHKCNSCGATLEMDSDKHIFLCKYCGSAYAVGTQMINDRG